VLKLKPEQIAYLPRRGQVQQIDFRPPDNLDKVRLDSLEEKLNATNGKLALLQKEEIAEESTKEPETAEVFYGADGRIKSFRMGKFGAVVVRSEDGKMRKINIKQIQ
jgi:hypothetical protein